MKSILKLIGKIIYVLYIVVVVAVACLIIWTCKHVSNQDEIIDMQHRCIARQDSIICELWTNNMKLMYQHEDDDALAEEEGGMR